MAGSSSRVRKQPPPQGPRRTFYAAGEVFRGAGGGEEGWSGEFRWDVSLSRKRSGPTCAPGGVRACGGGLMPPE